MTTTVLLRLDTPSHINAIFCNFSPSQPTPPSLSALLEHSASFLLCNLRHRAQDSPDCLIKDSFETLLCEG